MTLASFARSPLRLGVVAALFGLVLVGVIAAPGFAAAPPSGVVIVPKADRFAPYVITIHAGQTVTWLNNDTDDHTVVSDDTFNSAGHQGFNQILAGTDSTGGTPGRITLRFNTVGTFAYYCRFHAALDGASQPIAPGPLGGIQSSTGNFGTPMSGIVTVLPN